LSRKGEATAKREKKKETVEYGPQKRLEDEEWLTDEEREYLKTHLVGMDDTKKRWYFNTMNTWTKKDYDNYDRCQMWMIFGAGSLPEEEENGETSKEPGEIPRNDFRREDR